jgi:hypothetical protein
MRKVALENERDSPVRATTNAAPRLTVEASTSWRCNVLFATLMALAIPASPISAVGRCLTRESRLTRGDITIDPLES